MTLLKQLWVEMQEFRRMINWRVALEMLLILLLGLTLLVAAIRWFLLWPNSG